MLYCSSFGDENAEVFHLLEAALEPDFFVFSNTEYKQMSGLATDNPPLTPVGGHLYGPLWGGVYLCITNILMDNGYTLITYFASGKGNLMILTIFLRTLTLEIATFDLPWRSLTGLPIS